MASHECWKIKAGRFVLILLCVGIIAAGCSDKKGETKTTSSKTKRTATSTRQSSNSLSSNFEPTRDGTPATATSAASGKFAQAGMTDISDNPSFFMARNLTPGLGVPQDLDKLIRPVLKQLFKDAKLVEDIGEQPPRIDGEVEENKLVYVVRLLLASAEADQLHTELHEKQGWHDSPRLGRKPSHGRKEASMSLFRSTSLRSYSFVIGVNYETQKITVISYRLGSKYDQFR